MVARELELSQCAGHRWPLESAKAAGAQRKFPVLLGLLGVLVETAGRHGEAPQTVSTRELAGAVVERSWPHIQPFEGDDVLRQNQTGHAEIVA